jgi:glycosyltransferase involved in cell wall biosynthesis
MIYICIPTHNDAVTVGLVLWKVRQVFSAFPREYHLLVADDGSTDATSEVLEPYLRALPLTLIRHEKPLGHPASVEALLREALNRSDRPKRDFAVTIHADFSVSPAALPELVRAMESGADLVVAEALEGEKSFAMRLVRRSAPWLLRPGLNVPGVRDLLSGVCAIRLATLRYCLKDPGQSLLELRGRSAWAELVARTAAVARQISVVSILPAEHPHQDPSKGSAFTLALELFRAGRRLRVPAPAAEVRRAS